MSTRSLVGYISEFPHIHAGSVGARYRGATGRRSCCDFVRGSRTLACRLPPRLVTRKPTTSPSHPNAIDAPV